MISCQVCEHNPTGERCELFGRVIGMHGCSSGVERKPRNHFEMLKAMSMTQMAVLLAAMLGVNPFDGTGNDYNKFLEWLKEET